MFHFNSIKDLVLLEVQRHDFTILNPINHNIMSLI